MATSLRSELQNARMEAAAQLSVLGVEFHSSASSSPSALCVQRPAAVRAGDRTDIFEARGNAQTLEEQVSGSSRRSSKASNVCGNHKRISSGIGFLQFASASSQ